MDPRDMTRMLAVWLIVGAAAAPAGAQVQAPEAPEEEAAQEVPFVYEETVVVTASRVEQALVNAPATVSVLTGETIMASPALTYADLLRTVPGVNVTQTSARDINITSRGATSTLSTSQLALLDGRSIYQDFFGFVMWDFLPVSFDEIRQIEVIRGPASAVWGANALTGVVNVITRTPRELQGSSFTLGAGGFGRSVAGSDEGPGSVFYLHGWHADAPNDRWAYKVSAGAHTQDPLARPTGTIRNAFNTPYPPFANSGTTQPKFDARVDYDFEDGRRRLVVAGGVAGTKGIIHTGIGPFDINPGTVLGYTRMNVSRGTTRLNAFVNVLDGDARNLLSRDERGNPIDFFFSNRTVDVELGDVRTVGTTHVLSYGGNIRHNSFDLSLAPRGDSRTEVGVYVQDEIFLNQYFRWNVGARVDRFSVLDHPVFSPRTTFIVKAAPEHSIRFSYNRAYRAPSLVNNFLEIGIVNQIDLGLINPALAGMSCVFPVQGVGFEDLDEESMDAYEVGYSGTVLDNRATVTAAFYVNQTRDNIFFTQVGSYSSASPPPGWPLPPIVLDLLIAGGAFGPGNGLPAVFSYRNLGRVEQRGVELGVDAVVNRYVDAFANYSWQGEPVPTGFDISELNLPATHRVNAGFSFTYERYQGNLSISHAGEAFWQDVLDQRFHGPTDAYTLVNAGIGVRWGPGDRTTSSIKAANLINRDVQQHVFGDVMKRQVVGELRVRF